MRRWIYAVLTRADVRSLQHLGIFLDGTTYADASTASHRFIELPMGLCQAALLRPVVDEAKANRKGILFMTAAPNPSTWRLQVVALSRRGCEKVRKIIRDELGPAHPVGR